jgi:hypothetical protein
VAGDGAAFVLTAGDPACRAAGAALWRGVPLESLARDDLRPRAPFEGLLFDLLAARPRGETVGFVTPGAWAGEAEERPAGDLVPIADHVGLEGRGPLTGRWPAGVPRDFPSMTGVYQPSAVRSCDGARVYSSGVVAAGVADARHRTRFAALAVREGGWSIVSDSLVPVAIVAAYYGLRLAACVVVQAPRYDRE